MLAFLVFTVLTTAAGVVALVLMIARDEPVLGALGVMLLCGAGMFGTAYGVLGSSG